MKQTSQAIALLVASASAAVVDITAASPYQSAAATWMASKTLASQTNVSQALSRTAGYTNANNLDGWTWTAVVTAKSFLANAYMTGTTLEGAAGAVTKAGSSTCVNCIAGGAVWCSRTFSYVITGSSVTTYNKDATSYNLGVQAQVASTDATTWTSATAADQGSCCNTAALYVALVGLSGTAPVLTAWAFAQGTSATQSSLPAGNAGPANACVASANTPTGTGADAAWGQTSIETGVVAFTSWWCSNGLYKTLTAANTANRNATQLLNQNDNQRLELALVGCPMIASKCGLLTTDTGVYTLADTTTVTTVNMTKAMLMTPSDKCTWVAQSILVAPTFKMTVGSDATASNNLGITSNNWVIHHMEYMANAIAQTSFQENNGALIQQAASSGGFQQLNQALGYGNKVPKFTMQASQFATLRTWYGSSIGLTSNTFGATSVYGAQAGTWFSPYSNIASATKANQVYLAAMTTTQQYGNVSNIPYSTIVDNTTAANVGSTVNYGNNSTSQRFDFRTVRYMPVSSAQTVWAAGSALNTSYTAATTSYATAKTTWNAYVAILKKNAKMDAFAAAFSPPKAPTVPPLPNMPWTPSAYSGYLKQTPSQTAVMLLNQGLANNYVSGAQPTNQQFWASLDAAQTIGGWGSFTAAIIQFRDGWGKSFGTIGYSPGTGYNTMSQVWSVPAMCGSASSISGQGPTTACDKVYTATANSAATPTGVAAIAQTTFTFVTVVSLWSKGSANSDATKLANGLFTAKSSLGLVFTGGEWSSTIQSLGAITAPGAPTAADSLTGVAGASALAASSAAVLAIAALY